MIKNITSLEVEIDKKVYKFICDIDSPIGAVHDALVKMKGFVVEKINEATPKEEPAAPPVEEKPQES